MKTIKFTPAQAACMLHRLECFDCLEQVFGDTEGLEHLAPLVWDQAESFTRQLINNRCITFDPASELDFELLKEAIEGNTWLAVHESDGVSRQALTAARCAIKQCAAIIEQAMGWPEGEVVIPEC